MAAQDSGKPTIHVLVVDHDPARLEQTCRRLLGKGYDVSTTRTASGLSGLVQRSSPDIVLVDVLMPGFHGEEMFLLLSQCRPGSRPAIVLHTQILRRLLRTVVDVRDVLGVVRATSDDAQFSSDFDAVAARLPPVGRVGTPQLGRATSGTHRIVRSDKTAGTGGNDEDTDRDTLRRFG